MHRALANECRKEGTLTKSIFDVAQDYDMRVIGQNLARAREACGLKIQDVAEYLNVSYQVVWKWEHGLCLPQTDKALALMVLYGAEARDLIGSKEEDRGSSSHINGILLGFL